MHLGLDHSGMMTSVPFNVGLLANAVGGDPYSEDTYPSGDDFLGALNKSVATAKGRGTGPIEPPTGEVARKAAEDAKNGNEG